MKIQIKRDTTFSEFEVDLKDATLLEVLQHIKSTQDSTLSFVSGCRSSVCGSCAMRVNEKEVLACGYKVKNGDKIEPLKNVEVIRDLVVNMDKAYAFNVKAKAWQISSGDKVTIFPKDEKINEIQSDCILCGSCYSACPVYAVNKEFLGPFTLTRMWRYVSDKREISSQEKVTNIQTNGIWDCTLCNECTLSCPQGISSKADIEKLRSKSASFGFMDPSFGNFGGGFGFDGTPSF